MKKNKTKSIMGFLLTLSALNAPATNAALQANTEPTQVSIEERIANINANIKDREEKLSDSPAIESDPSIVAGWADRSGGGSWVNARRGGWADGHGGGFVNRNPWRNGWGDGGSFWNSH